MAYQSLYRRYRPQRFSEVRGQEHLVRALRNAVRDERVGHAYLFSGPRGTGKTSTARILAKALNCTALEDGEPCGTCDSCLAIAEGSSFDVFELDAASHNGVDDIRDLVERASQSSPGRTKVYILDEVHMLSSAASNALLKTLEEPPAHVVFVLATTDPQKVLPTIRSRTQHFEVHLLSGEELGGLVDDVVADAGLTLDDEGRAHVLREGRGSARDTLSTLEQVVAFGGIPTRSDATDDLVEALADHDTGRALVAVEQAIGTGQAPRTLGDQLIARLRDVFLAALGQVPQRLTDDERSRVDAQARRLGARGATHALEVLGDALVGIADAPDQRVVLEVALVRLTRPELDVSPAALLARIERLEQGGGAAGATTSSVPDGAAASAGSATTAEPRAPGTSAGTEAPAVDPSATDVTPPASGSQGEPDNGAAAAARETLAAKKAARRGGSTDTRRRPPTAPARSSASSSAPPDATEAKAPEPSADTSSSVEPSDTPAPTQAAAEPSATPAASTPAAKPAPAPSASAASPADSGELPTRDELTLAWGDVVLASLPQKAKARFGAGRFVAVEDAAVFGLPNEVHRSRCEEVRPVVEEALSAHFGRPVPLRLVVDGDAPEPPARASERAARGASRATPTETAAEPEEPIDLTELVDAPDAAESDLERVTQVFPGAEIVEEETEP